MKNNFIKICFKMNIFLYSLKYFDIQSFKFIHRYNQIVNETNIRYKHQYYQHQNILPYCYDKELRNKFFSETHVLKPRYFINMITCDNFEYIKEYYKNICT